LESLEFFLSFIGIIVISYHIKHFFGIFSVYGICTIFQQYVTDTPTLRLDIKKIKMSIQFAIHILFETPSIIFYTLFKINSLTVKQRTNLLNRNKHECESNR
jgi:hypothetical protein